MGAHRPSRSTSLALLLAVAASAWILLPGAGGGARAQDDGVLRAESICEAKELEARKAEEPDLRIEIPEEYDQPFPTLEACRSHELAWAEDAPGPRQPIPFSHAHHAGRFEIDCLYCHSGTDRSQAAGVPSVELCMGCHANFPASYDTLEGIRILKQHWAERETIEWVQVHRLPEHVQFRHNRHVAAGVACETCHGPVREMEKLHLVSDTQWGPTVMPTQKLQMGWCLNCHRKQGASQDCTTCHY